MTTIPAEVSEARVNHPMRTLRRGNLTVNAWVNRVRIDAQQIITGTIAQGKQSTLLLRAEDARTLAARLLTAADDADRLAGVAR